MPDWPLWRLDDGWLAYEPERAARRYKHLYLWSKRRGRTSHRRGNQAGESMAATLAMSARLF